MSNRFWQLDKRPEGNDFADALSLQKSELPTLGDGEILIRNHYISMDAGTRMWMTDREDGYQPPLPLGIPMSGLVLGPIEASNNPDFPVGQWVRAFGQWADYSCIDPVAAGAFLLDQEVSDMRHHLGALGMNGWTALWGIETTGGAKQGETVLVSAAAGATGVLACQIAKLLGCRTVGIAGGREKCRFLTQEIGADLALDYKSDDFVSQLDAAGGIDVYFDNVGGEILDHVLTRMNHYGRVAVCGLLSDYTGSRTSPAEFDQVLMRRLRVEGFFSPDFMHHGPELTARLKTWVEAGKLDLPFDTTIGLENTLTAYAKLFTGGNIGKVIVELEQ